MKDVELLEQHRGGSEQAFAELVRRHIGWVYGVARRRLRDEHLAEDVAQAVFVLLHRKSPRFPADGAMIRWMHRTAGYASQVAIRNQQRRVKHESEAAMLRPTSTDQLDENQWHELAPILDELVGRLSRTDREAVLLRYYRDMSFAEVGSEIGVGADAARKRVERAVEKLRAMASKQGLAASGATFALGLSEQIRIPTPPGLLASATGIPAAPLGSALAANSASIVKGTIFMMTIKKAAIAAVVVFSMMTVGGTIWAVLPGDTAIAPEQPAPENPTDLVALAPIMRWNGDIPQLQLDKQWYELVKINDLPIAQFTDAAKRLDPDLWERRFQEDLDQVLAAMKLPLGPFKLELRKLDTGKTVMMNNVAATDDNRLSLMWGEQPDFSKPTATLFSAIRWQDKSAQVQVDGHDIWYGLVDVDGVPASQIFDFARTTYGDHWQKQIEENSIDVLHSMGHRFGPGVAWLRVTTMDTHQTFRILKRTHDEKSPQQAVAVTKPKEDFPRLSPFSAVRWTNTDYQIELNGTWYGLVAIDDQLFTTIVDFARRQYGEQMLQKRIDEDLVEVLTTMGHKPAETVKLQLRALDTGELITRDHVAMTSENRSKILNDRQPTQNPAPAAPAPPTGTSGL